MHVFLIADRKEKNIDFKGCELPGTCKYSVSAILRKSRVIADVAR